MEKILLDSYPIITSLGLVGNILTIFLLSSKKFDKTIFDIYFRAMCLFDSLVAILPIHYYLKFKLNIDIANFSQFTCYSVDYLIYVLSPCSTYILIFISFDRMLFVSNSNIFSFRLNKKFQIGYCLAVFIMNLIYYMPMIVFFKQYSTQLIFNNSTNKTEIQISCLIVDNGVLYWMDLFFSTIIPFMAMFIFTCITIVKLFKSKTKTNGIKYRDLRFAFISIALNICFFLMVFPITAFILIASYLNLNEETYQFYFIIFLVFYILNYADKFYISLATNSLFRNEFTKKINHVLGKFLINFK